MNDAVTKEDFRELRKDLRDGIVSLREGLDDLGEKLSQHALEDADREGRAAAEIGAMRVRIDNLSESVTDRHKFVRGWIGGLLALAVSATVGFLLRSSLPW
jgi:hypothetical protein